MGTADKSITDISDGAVVEVVQDEIPLKKKRVEFSSSFSTAITLLGFSFGLSDFWRFAFLAYRNGGGAFLIPFLVSVILVGLPLYIMEFSLGKFSGKGPFQMWDICPLFRGAGLSIITAYCFYVIGASIFRVWIVEFFVNVFQSPLPWDNCNNAWNTATCRRTLVAGPMPSNTSLPVNGSVTETVLVIAQGATNNSVVQMTSGEEFWQYKVLQLSTGVTDLAPVQWRYILYMVGLRIIVSLTLVKSIKSLEKVMVVTTFLPFVVTIAIFIQSLTLPGALDGIRLFFVPDFSRLLEPRIWIEASLMAFYSLSFGWGAIIMIGSHSGFKQSCYKMATFITLSDTFYAIFSGCVCFADVLLCVSGRMATFITFSDTFYAIFSGFVCFAVLGNVAHKHDVPVEEVVNAGMSAGIVAYISALATLPGSNVWSFLFFIAVLLTGLDSQMIAIEMSLQVISNAIPSLRKKNRLLLLTALTVVIFLVALPTCTGAGAYLFLLVDWYSGVWIGPIVAFAEVMVVAWVYGLDRFNHDVYLMTGREPPALLRLCLAFVSPVFVLILFLTSCVEYVPPTYGQYRYPGWARLFGWATVVIIMLPMVVQAARASRRGTGSCVKKLREQLKATAAWGPIEETETKAYEEETIKYANRSLKDLFWYNLLGRYPANSHMAMITQQEMTRLRQS